MIYADTSALVKLVVQERESLALYNHLDSLGHVSIACSQLGETELLRNARRFGPEAVLRARSLLAAINIAPLTSGIAALAAELAPEPLRTLDALHLATAMDLRASPVIAYDRRLIEACIVHNVEVISPGDADQ